MGPRLKTEFWVKAHIRRCAAADIPAFVLRRGFDEAGSVLLKINRFDRGCRVLVPTVDTDGNRAWMRAVGEAPLTEAEADAYIARQVERDPDIWVLEIEDRDDKHQLDSPIL